MSSARRDDVDQAGGPDDHLADLPPVEEPAGVLRSQGELATGGLVGGGVHLETVPDLPVHLNHKGHPLVADEFGVERRPRRDMDTHPVSQGLPPQLLGHERREGPQHLHHGRGGVASARPNHWFMAGRRCRSGAISFQSMSSPNGPANRMLRRKASEPHRSTNGIASTRFPFDLLIDAPPKITCPWFISRGNGSVNPTMPISWRTLVRNRE